MFWIIQSAISLGILWGIMSLGVYITFRVLNFADLTVDGSFTLGGAISAVMAARGVNPLLAVIIAMIGGMAAGLCTGLLHTKLRIPGLLASILTQMRCIQLNLRVWFTRVPLSQGYNYFLPGLRKLVPTRWIIFFIDYFMCAVIA
jgi:putative ABC transport system permease protein